jgi:carbonic anhydrase
VIASREAKPVNLLGAAITENVRRAMQAVTAAQPLLAEMIASGKVKVAGGVYDIATGSVTQL